MNDFRKRLLEEHSQLEYRINKLDDFILSNGYEQLNEIEKDDLREQLKHMKLYFSVLNKRVNRLCNNN